MITSTGNSQVRNLVQLKKKAKERRKQQLYIVEGSRMFAEAPADRIERIYVSESFVSGRDHREMLSGKEYEVLADSVFDYVSDTRTPQGILCLMRMRQYSPNEIFPVRVGGDIGRGPAVHETDRNGAPVVRGKGESGFWLVLENLQDPGNLGAMFRTGEGAGVAGVIMDAATADIYNPKTIRSTMGSIYRIPFLITEDLQETLRTMKTRGIRIFAAHLEGSLCYDEPDYTTDTAFLIGNEGNGLTPETAATADVNIRIPMGGQLESLNAAMAAGILMYEANRQRRRG
ncbi:MAG: RNA methyltransferase [Clostridiales bacterium]|nr:RNA methyltransferase [Clostridiales bacterium]